MENQNNQINRQIRNFLILPAFQLRFILWLFISGICLTAVNVLSIYLFFRQNYLDLIKVSPLSDSAKAQAYADFNHFVPLSIGISIFFLVIIMALGIVFSHRTAGPLFHFKRVFEDIKQGNPNARIRLRPKDEFKEVADSFNQMMDKMEPVHVQESLPGQTGS